MQDEGINGAPGVRVVGLGERSCGRVRPFIDDEHQTPPTKLGARRTAVSYGSQVVELLQRDGTTTITKLQIQVKVQFLVCHHRCDDEFGGKVHR